MWVDGWDIIFQTEIFLSSLTLLICCTIVQVRQGSRKFNRAVFIKIKLTKKKKYRSVFNPKIRITSHVIEHASLQRHQDCAQENFCTATAANVGRFRR